MRLAETQAAIRNAVIADEGVSGLPLKGGVNPLRRLAIHRRHYHASLAAALTTKFPATAWLMGPPDFSAAAAAYVRANPPAAPCIAEYGEGFPAFIAGWPASARAPYLAEVAAADWHLGRVSIAVDAPALSINALAPLPAAELEHVRFVLQPGLRFLAVEWAVDTLIALRLGGEPPAALELRPEKLWLEFSGARGIFRINRLDAGTFAFRRALADGAPLGEAAARGLAASPDYDVGAALASVFADGLVIGTRHPLLRAGP